MKKLILMLALGVTQSLFAMHGPSTCPPTDIVRASADAIDFAVPMRFLPNFYVVATTQNFGYGNYSWMIYLRGIQSDSKQSAIQKGRDKTKQISSPLTAFPMKLEDKYICQYFTAGTLVFVETPG